MAPDVTAEAGLFKRRGRPNFLGRRSGQSMWVNQIVHLAV